MPDPHLEAIRAEMLASRAAAFAPAAPQHGVAGHPPPEPRRVDALADRGDRAGPFVPDPDRIGGLTGGEVGHLAREELDVGPADPDALDLYDARARSARRHFDRPDLGRARTRDHECPHRLAAHRTRVGRIRSA